MAIPSQVLGLGGVIREALRTKTGFAGFAMIGFLVALIVAVPLYAPFDVVNAWSSRESWLDNPRLAAPEWTELFAGKKLPRTTILDPCFGRDNVPISVVTGPEDCPGGSWGRRAVQLSLITNITYLTLTQKFTYDADVFPSELRMVAWAQFGTSASRILLNWTRPDGTSIILLDVEPRQRAPTDNVYPISQMQSSQPGQFNVHEAVREWAIGEFSAEDVNLIAPHVTLFAKGGPSMLQADKAEVLKGEYTLKIDMVAFGGGSGLDVKFTVYGRVFGIAGTDASRRDLLVGLLWGAPVALAFATVASVVIILLQLILGALATWYGGRYDELVQRASDLLLILPVFPILILLSVIYRPGIFTILLVLVAFGFVGGTSKIARSIVLQVKEEAYIESAISYGASRRRILFKHIMPRLLPYTFALIALAVPSFIFLEASLSFLGLGDPTLPTWGAILGDAYNGSAPYLGFWWWIAFPAGGIVFATVAFALLGYSFDKVLNPRLREE